MDERIGKKEKKWKAFGKRGWEEREKKKGESLIFETFLSQWTNVSQTRYVQYCS